MTDEPEKVWISFDETLKPTDPPGYWPKGWPAVFKQPRDSGVLYVRADPVEELRAKSEAFDRIVEARERATPVIVTAANETEPFTSRGREPEILSINNGETP